MTTEGTTTDGATANGATANVAKARSAAANGVTAKDVTVNGVTVEGVTAAAAGAIADGLTMRAARPDDIPAILAFWRGAAEGVSITDDEDGLGRLLARDSGALLVAERGGTVVGTVIAGWDGWRCHLYRLAVAPDARRQGIARALLRAAEERFTALGGRRGDAMVLDRNELGRSAWRAAGYEPQPQWTRWIKVLARRAN